MEDIEKINNGDRDISSADFEKGMLQIYLEASRRKLEIEAVKHGLLSIIQDVKACQDQNIRALLFDIERCLELTAKFLIYWETKTLKIESHIDLLTQEITDDSQANRMDKEQIQAGE